MKDRRELLHSTVAAMAFGLTGCSTKRNTESKNKNITTSGLDRDSYGIKFLDKSDYKADIRIVANKVDSETLEETLVMEKEFTTSESESDTRIWHQVLKDESEHTIVAELTKVYSPPEIPEGWRKRFWSDTKRVDVGEKSDPVVQNVKAIFTDKKWEENPGALPYISLNINE